MARSYPTIGAFPNSKKLEDAFGLMTVNTRRMYLEAMLHNLVGFEVQSQDFGLVKITRKSVHEIAVHASKSAKSSVAAMNVVKVIENAKDDGCEYQPHSRKQREEFRFQTVYLLYVRMQRLGLVKLTIGRRKSGVMIEYCCTAQDDK